MNNRFKFRVWDIEKKYYLTQDDEYHFYETERLGDWQCPIPLSECLRDVKRYIVQQYTGLKDKNGQEIYEGDIVSFFFFLRDESGKEYDNPIESKAVVKYKEDSAEFVLEIFGYKGSGWTFSMLMAFIDIQTQEWRVNERIKKLKLTVIGNIFENPELLNSENQKT